MAKIGLSESALRRRADREGRLVKSQKTGPKLKRARGALLRAINSGRVPPPPGYEGPPKN